MLSASFRDSDPGHIDFPKDGGERREIVAFVRASGILLNIDFGRNVSDGFESRERWTRRFVNRESYFCFFDTLYVAILLYVSALSITILGCHLLFGPLIDAFS